MRRDCLRVACCVLALLGCDEEEAAPPPAAPAAEAPTVAPAVPPAPVEPPAAATGERVDSEMTGHLPTALAGVVAIADGSRALGLGGDFLQLDAPAGASVRRGGDNWTYLRGVEPGVAIYQHNPAGDDGEDCPTLEVIRQRLGDAQVTETRRVAVPWSGEGPAFGDEIDLLLFTRGERAGFYVRKRFDHGDDYTDLCAAFGASDDALSMGGLGTPEQARRMAAAILTARENL